MKLGLEKRLRAVMTGENAPGANLDGDLEKQARENPAGEVARRLMWMLARASQIESTDKDRAIAEHFTTRLRLHQP